MSDNQDTSEPGEIHGLWSSQFAFVLAATGSAVGLGNIWKFPYITGQNGGGAFVLVYLFCILLIGIPVLMCEVLIGRRGRRSPAESVKRLAQEAGAKPAWQAIGWFGVLAGFLILTFYVVIAGWAVAYVYFTATGRFSGATGEEVGAFFGAFTGDASKLLTWGTLVLIGTMIIVGNGVQKGLERAVRFMMPGMLGLLLVMVGYAMNTGEFAHGMKFLFQPDFSALTANGVLVALGHAFFTLSLASGAMLTYGAYLPKDASITRTVVFVAIADTVVALLAGMAIFPIVFSNGLEPGAGPGLIFVTLPIAFGQMPYGTIFGTLFFTMLSLAAITSAISLIEPAVAWLVERTRLSRVRACVISGVAVWVFSLGTVFSFNHWSELTVSGKTFFDALDYLTANIMLPLGGLFVCIFTAWILSTKVTREELALGDSPVYSVWLFTIRFLAPAAILIVFLNAVGILNFDS